MRVPRNTRVRTNHIRTNVTRHYIVHRRTPDIYVADARKAFSLRFAAIFLRPSENTLKNTRGRRSARRVISLNNYIS